MNTPLPPTLSARRQKLETVGLLLLFGTMYFVQGVAEPTEGLIAQPVRSLLRRWEYSTFAISTFSFLLALPWVFKPIYGLLTDFVPLCGTRRRSYLLLTTGVTVLGLLLLYTIPAARGQHTLLLLLLVAPTIGVAFGDVVVDGLMVEKGQPRGLTGRLQSVQWAAMYAATMLAGWLGGYLSHHNHQQLGFLLCAGATLITFFLAWFFVREERQVASAGALQTAARELGGAARTPAVGVAALFLLLWNFNPFSASVLENHMTRSLGMSEQFTGWTVVLLSAGAIAGSLAYGLYCRRVSLQGLFHGAVLAGILSTLAYWGLKDQMSASIISAIVGFTYMSGSLVQLDLAARACPASAAGTTFALLMGLSNLSLMLSALVGGYLYDSWSTEWGTTNAFNALVGFGAMTTSACWLLTPAIRRITAS